MFRIVEAAPEQKVIGGQPGLFDPLGNRLPGVFGNLELDRLMSLLLHDYRAGLHLAAVGDIGNPQFEQITASELAVYRQIEQRQVTGLSGQLEASSDRPDLGELQW